MPSLKLHKTKPVEMTSLLLQLATVVAVEPAGVWVEPCAESACVPCQQGKGCGVGLFNRLLFSQRKPPLFMPITPIMPIDLRPGQSVMLGLPKQGLLYSVLLVYIVPLLCLILGSVMMQELLPNIWSLDLKLLLGMVFGFGIGFYMVSCLQKIWAKSLLQELVLLERCPNI